MDLRIGAGRRAAGAGRASSSVDVTTVVGNLVDNALDAAAGSVQRWVEVDLGLVDGEVDVVVRDSGAGVPAGMEREIFRRGVSTKAIRGDGQASGAERGIGLSLVHLVCTRRGGDVTATSDGGSTFTARLPAAPDAGEPVIRVLIVDDDFMVAKVHAGFVAALDGFEVVGTAVHGRRGAGRGAAAATGPGAARHLPART